MGNTRKRKSCIYCGALLTGKQSKKCAAAECSRAARKVLRDRYSSRTFSRQVCSDCGCLLDKLDRQGSRRQWLCTVCRRERILVRYRLRYARRKRKAIVD